MYRRIELIHHYLDVETKGIEHYKSGLMGNAPKEVIEAWLPLDPNEPSLRGPWRKSEKFIPHNARFYFTEKGWDKIGRKVIAACIKTEQDYRVIAIKETDAQVIWRDKVTNYEVAVQPKRKR